MAVTESWSAWDILTQIFSVSTPSDALIGSSNDTVIRTLLYYFNSGILMAVIAIYAFVLVIGTINTARDGVFLGKNWSTHWISLRVILGSACAFPLKSGFCIAQYLVFLMVAVSINFANYVWDMTNHDIKENNIPAIMGVDIVNGLKTNMAAYLLANYTNHILLENGGCNNKANGGADEKLCHSTIDSDANQMTVAIAGKEIANNIQSVGLSTVDPFFKKINNRGQTEINLAVIDYLKQGMLSWTNVFGSSYNQTRVTNIINQYQFSVPNTAPDTTEVSGALAAYCKQGEACELIPLIANTELDYSARFPEFSSTAPKVPTLDAISSAILKGLKNQLEDQEQQLSVDSNNLDKNNDWWNADQQYFTLDNTLAENLSAFYSNFAIFNRMMQGSTNSVIQLHKSGVSLEYIYQTHDVDTLSKKAGSGDLHYRVTPSPSDKVQTTELLPIHVLPDAKADKVVAYKMDKFIQKFQHILMEAKVNCSELSKGLYPHTNKDDSCKTLIANIIPSSLPAGLGKYFIIIDAALNGNNIENEAKEVTALLYLMRFFQINKVSFVHGGNMVTNVAEPAQLFLNEIFSKLSISSGASSILSQIYNFGDSTTGDSSQHYSMIRELQGLGKSIIKMTIDSLRDVTGKIWRHTAGEIATVMAVQTATSALALASSVIPWISTGPTIALVGNAALQVLISAQMLALSASLVWLPLVFFVLMALFGIGVLFALVIPMTPFILFWAGKMAWLLLVIEALVAAPIVALGIVYPEGHEVFGKAESGIQIMLSLVLRPVLMIVGIITAMVLTYVIISASAKGFHVVATQLSSMYGASNDNYVTGSFNLLLVLMYATFLSMAFYKCFSLIYILPDKILMWIGGGQNERAGTEEMQEIKSTTSQQAQSMASSATQTVDKYAKQSGDIAKESQNSGASTSQAAGQIEEDRRKGKDDNDRATAEIKNN